MKKYAKLLFALTITLIVLAGCGENGYDDYNTDEHNDYEYYEQSTERAPSALDDALAKAYERRQNIVRPDYTTLLSLTQGRVPDSLPEGLFWELEGQTGTVNTAQALEDMELLFTAMRNAYGGYVYFGGDDVFMPIKEAVMSDIEDIEGYVTIRDLERILASHISPVIHDRHFQIGDSRFGENIAIYQIPAHTPHYDKTENGFRNRSSGLYLKSVEGHEINDIMRLNVDRDGQLFYAPIIQLPWVPNFELQFTYEDDTIQTHRFVEVNATGRQTQLPTLRVVDGIPVVTVMQMGFDGHQNAWNIEHALPFLSFAEELRGEPVVIVDIRNNGGGNGWLAQRWLYSLLGETVFGNHVSLVAEAPERRSINPHPFNPNNVFQNPPGTWEMFWDASHFGDGYIIRDIQEREIVYSEPLLILLTDRFTGSAGDGFADLFMSMSNTLVIGEPTAGVLAFDRTYPSLFLPNSGLLFGFGRTKMVWPEGLFAESYGLHPDIWVLGANALTSTISLLQNAGFGDQ